MQSHPGIILPLLVVGIVVGSILVSAADRLPAFKAERWVNSAPLTAAALHGKVVLVDFWEYTCINWIRTLPYIQAWNRDYAGLGLVVVGVHAPEFEFGKRAENIDRGIRDHGLTYPIAIDNQFAIWRSLGNDAWPAKYLFDREGKLIKRWVGEGRYDEIEAEIYEDNRRCPRGGFPFSKPPPSASRPPHPDASGLHLSIALDIFGGHRLS
jgi:thiol-disulfide isomerase/thioredoxin